MNTSIIFFFINGSEKKYSNLYGSIFEGQKDYGKPFHILIPEILEECDQILTDYYEKF